MAARGMPDAYRAGEARKKLPFVGLGLATLGLAVGWLLMPANVEYVVTGFEVLVGIIAGVAATRSVISHDPRTAGASYEAIASPGGRLAVPRPAELTELERVVAFSSSRAVDAEVYLRPVLRELAAARLERRGIDALDSQQAALALGPRLWEFIQPDRVPIGDRFAPGLSLDTTEAIVDTLEQL